MMMFYIVALCMQKSSPFFCENVTHTLSGHIPLVGFHHIPKVLYWPEFGNCEGCSSTVNSLPHSRNQYDLILALWRCSIEVAFRRLVHCGHKGMDTVGNNTQGGCVLWTPPPEWIHIVSHQIQMLQSKCSSRNLDSSDKTTFLQCFCNLLFTFVQPV